MSGFDLKIFSDAQALADAASAQLSNVLDTALERRGRASAMLSGGSSPKPIYERLAQAPLAWDGVTVSLVDERWVPSWSKGSNADFIRDCFAGTPAERAHFVPLYNGHETPEAGVEAGEQALALMAQPFDLCVMGMGLDGHTASWFPHSGGLDAALDPDNGAVLAAIDATGCEVAGDHTDRITLTFAAVAAARNTVLILPSTEKLRVFQQSLDRDPRDAPVRKLAELEDRLTIFALDNDS